MFYQQCTPNSPFFAKCIHSLSMTPQTHHVYSTLKRRGNNRFRVVSTWNTRGVFVGNTLLSKGLLQRVQCICLTHYCLVFTHTYLNKPAAFTKRLNTLILTNQYSKYCAVSFFLISRLFHSR